MGLFSKVGRKLGVKKDKKRSPAKGQDVYDGPRGHTVGQATFQMAEAPPRPFLGGPGLTANKIYTLGSAAPSNNVKTPAEAKEEIFEDEASRIAKQEEAGPSGAESLPEAPARQSKTPDRVLIGDAAEGKVIHAKAVFTGLFVVSILMTLIFMWLLKVRVLEVLLWTILAAPLGVACSYAFVMNKNTKEEHSSVLKITPGMKALKMLFGVSPSWVGIAEKEKVEWLNRILEEMWPFYDKAISATVKEAVEPLMKEYKPPGLIKNIYFKHLTFGDSPFRVENVWVENEGENYVLLEVAFRWAGEANIAIAVELPAGGDATRMVPKVSNLQVSGVLRVMLSPLVPVIPCFGAAVISLRKPPLIHFKLDFGRALGSGYTGKPVRMWLDGFLRNTLTSLLVWPNRITVPLMPEDVTGSLEHLALKHVGVLVVKVVEAAELKKMDMIGKADPFVEMYVQPENVQKTAHKKNTLEPSWNETLWLLVQEPKTQHVRVELFDHDQVNLKELVSINVLKGVKDSFGAKTLMGRMSLPLEGFARNPGMEVDDWYHLGLEDYSNDDGCGRGEGRLHLRTTYVPFDLLYTADPTAASRGAVLVRLDRADNLYAADRNGMSDPYAKLKLNDVERRSTTKPATLSPEWKEEFVWYNVPIEEQLTVELFDADIAGDDFLGVLELNLLEEVAKAPNATVRRSWDLEEVPVDKSKGAAPPSTLTMKVQFVPYHH